MRLHHRRAAQQRLCVRGDSAALAPAPPLPLPRSLPPLPSLPSARAPHPSTALGWLPPSLPAGGTRVGPWLLIAAGRAELPARGLARRAPVERRGAGRGARGGAARRGSAAQNGADGGAARVAVVLRRDRVVRRRVLHPPARPAQGAGAAPERRSGGRGRRRGSGRGGRWRSPRGAAVRGGGRAEGPSRPGRVGVAAAPPSVLAAGPLGCAAPAKMSAERRAPGIPAAAQRGRARRRLPALTRPAAARWRRARRGCPAPRSRVGRGAPSARGSREGRRAGSRPGALGPPPPSRRRCGGGGGEGRPLPRVVRASRERPGPGPIAELAFGPQLQRGGPEPGRGPRALLCACGPWTPGEPTRPGRRCAAPACPARPRLLWHAVSSGLEGRALPAQQELDCTLPPSRCASHAGMSPGL